MKIVAAGEPVWPSHVVVIVPEVPSNAKLSH